jgi:hypothetical protein
MSLGRENPERAVLTAEAVAQILACADVAVEGIAQTAESEVIGIEAEQEEMAYEDAVQRKTRLKLLRLDLAEQATNLAATYASLVEHITELDRAVAELEGAEIAVPAPPGAGIGMTVRETQRMHFAGEVPQEPPAQPAQAQWPATEASEPPPGRSWLPWQRAA